MFEIKANEKGELALPEAFLQRRHLAPQTEYWLDEREGELILHPRLPDVRKLYLEPTTACNLRCRTCIRHVWEDTEAPMTMETQLRSARHLRPARAQRGVLGMEPVVRRLPVGPGYRPLPLRR